MKLFLALPLLLSLTALGNPVESEIEGDGNELDDQPSADTGVPSNNNIRFNAQTQWYESANRVGWWSDVPEFKERATRLQAIQPTWSQRLTQFKRRTSEGKGLLVFIGTDDYSFRLNRPIFPDVQLENWSKARYSEAHASLPSFYLEDSTRFSFSDSDVEPGTPRLITLRLVRFKSNPAVVHWGLTVGDKEVHLRADILNAKLPGYGREANIFVSTPMFSKKDEHQTSLMRTTMEPHYRDFASAPACRSTKSDQEILQIIENVTRDFFALQYNMFIWSCYGYTLRLAAALCHGETVFSKYVTFQTVAFFSKALLVPIGLMQAIVTEGLTCAMPDSLKMISKKKMKLIKKAEREERE